MKTVEEYLSHAAKANELAATTDDLFHKEKIAEISQLWLDLAEHRKRLLEDGGGTEKIT